MATKLKKKFKGYVIIRLEPLFTEKSLRITLKEMILDSTVDDVAAYITINFSENTKTNYLSEFFKLCNENNLTWFRNPKEFRIDLQIDKVVIGADNFDFETYLKTLNFVETILEIIRLGER